jgi:hypothetical protein
VSRGVSRGYSRSVQTILLALCQTDRRDDKEQSDLLQRLGVTEINANQTKLLREGMQTLTGYLALILDADEDGDDVVH